MVTIDELPVFDMDKLPELVGVGSEGGVYRVHRERGLVAKAYHFLFGDIKFPSRQNSLADKMVWYALREAVVARKLFEAGISVPRPEGLYALLIPEFNPTAVPGLVMEYVEVADPGLLYGKAYRQACMKADIERQKARDAGFSLCDSIYGHNVLFTLDKDGESINVKLHDFGGWVHPQLQNWMEEAEKEFLLQKMGEQR